ncbi:ankyrin repeat and death domain-containing protein 1A-like isoform X2 [Lineus longissimus]|uniref:ankyrin repeat and death domain-containing protein 1A-like isoform X2 n=1 Tax=Lineus longissimus TaxID=88925 RepID=UPI00315DCB5E
MLVHSGYSDCYRNNENTSLVVANKTNATMFTPSMFGDESEEDEEMPPSLIGTGQFQVADKKKKDAGEDVSMVGAFQETQMLKSEVILHEASRKNNIEVVKRLIGAKVNVNCTNNLDRTPLQWAAANGHIEVMQLLLQHGADIEAQDKYGMRAVLWAAWFGHDEGVKFLVSCGADPTSANKQGLNLLHCAANQNRTETMQFILESLDNFCVNAADKRGRTALHLAASEGHIDSVNTLIEKGCDVQVKDKAGHSPLHLAAGNGHTEVVRKLLHVGLEIDERDEEGRTALHMAAENGHAEVADHLLMSMADPNSETLKEMTALHVAATNGHELTSKLIIEYGCNIDAQNFQGNTALHLAALGNYAGIVRTLIQSGCDLDLPNTRLHTALHAAVEKGNADAVEELLIHGANINTQEKCGRTPLYMASRGSYIGIVDMIIKADRFRKAEKLERSRPNSMEKKPMENGLEMGDIRPVLEATVEPSKLSMSPEESAATSATTPENTIRVEEVLGEKAPLQFKVLVHPYSETMKSVLYRLASKQLKPGEWRKLAHHWNFSEEHIKAIQHQYTGETSHREHGYRMFLIWLHGIRPDENPMKQLYQGLCVIGRRNLAEQIRKKVEEEASGKTSTGCHVS